MRIKEIIVEKVMVIPSRGDMVSGLIESLKDSLDETFSKFSSYYDGVLTRQTLKRIQGDLLDSVKHQFTLTLNEISGISISFDEMKDRPKTMASYDPDNNSVSINTATIVNMVNATLIQANLVIDAEEYTMDEYEHVIDRIDFSNPLTYIDSMVNMLIHELTHSHQYKSGYKGRTEEYENDKEYFSDIAEIGAYAQQMASGIIGSVIGGSHPEDVDPKDIPNIIKKLRTDGKQMILQHGITKLYKDNVHNDKSIMRRLYSKTWGAVEDYIDYLTNIIK